MCEIVRVGLCGLKEGENTCENEREREREREEYIKTYGDNLKQTII